MTFYFKEKIKKLSCVVKYLPHHIPRLHFESIYTYLYLFMSIYIYLYQFVNLPLSDTVQLHAEYNSKSTQLNFVSFLYFGRKKQ